jgi:hypothetical protein
MEQTEESRTFEIPAEDIKAAVELAGDDWWLAWADARSWTDGGVLTVRFNRSVKA